LFFFSSDRGEPPHVHVTRDRKTAKFWLQPVRPEYNLGFAPTEIEQDFGIGTGTPNRVVEGMG